MENKAEKEKRKRKRKEKKKREKENANERKYAPMAAIIFWINISCYSRNNI